MSDTAEEVATLALAAQDRGELLIAAGIVEAALVRLPLAAGLWNNLGVLYADLGRWKEAVKAYERSVELGYPSWVGLGVARERCDDPVGAEGAYRAGLVQHPMDSDLLVNLGILLRETDRLAEAELTLMGAAAVDPTAHWMLADVYSDRGEPERALSALDAAIAAGELRALVDRAELLFDLDRDPEPDFNRAVHENVPGARRQYALYLCDEGEYERARALALGGLVLGDPGCNLPAALSSMALAEFGDAVGYFRAAIEAGDDEHEADLVEALARLNERGIRAP